MFGLEFNHRDSCRPKATIPFGDTGQGWTKSRPPLHRFLSANRFLWQSQNNNQQESKHGKLIRDHRDLAFKCTSSSVARKSRMARVPFVYCGLVDPASWEGEC